uniref:Uncharacterized protein n=1 Tax=Streptococcus pneumoniae TaxID=1313 RepID=G4XP84_STREE|nr:hypothetical protein [Streptococcus pneumoniae]
MLRKNLKYQIMTRVGTILAVLFFIILGIVVEVLF